ncbi:MAG: PAS domain S-box protein [Thermodesulfobacteriota bacterium]
MNIHDKIKTPRGRADEVFRDRATPLKKEDRERRHHPESNNFSQKSNVPGKSVKAALRAEEVFQGRETELIKIFSWVPGMIFQFKKKADGSFCIPFTTDAIQEIFGCSPQEVREDFSPLANVIIPEDFKRVMDSVQYSAEHLSEWSCEFRVRLPGQPPRWILGHSSPEKMADGSIIWHGFATDITRRKESEEKIHESEIHYRLLVDSSMDGVLLTAPDGGIINANPAACAILGYAEEEIRKLGRNGVVDTSDPNFSKGLEERDRTGKFRGELTFIRKDGRKIPVEISTAVFYDHKGMPRTSMMFRDITRRKEFIERLRKSEERYRTIIETIEEAYYEVDLEGNLVFFNDTFTKVFKTPREELVGVNFRAYTDEENAQKLFRAFNEAYRTGKPARDIQTEIIIRSSGEKRNVLTSVALVRDPSGNPVGFRGISKDITGIMQTQQALKESEDRYRDLVESSRDLMCTHDTGGQILWVNEEPARVLGYGKEKLLKMNIRDLVSPEYKKEFDAYLAAVLSKGRARGLMSLQTANGENRIWEYQNSLRTEGVKEPIIRSMSRDVTERVRAEREVNKTLAKLRKAINGIIQAMAITVESRDPYTAGHQKRVADLARAIAQEMGLSEDHVDGLRMAGIVHDLGKIGIPAEILSKPITLSEIEFKLIQAHPQISYTILKDIDFPWPVAQIVLQHHERIDGSGYPSGLRGNDILLEARILAVADVVEAIASHRPYRPSLGIEKALEEISRERGTLYDHKVVDSCLKLFKEKGYRFKEH